MAPFLPLLSFLLLSATATHAALPAQVYWDSALPNSPMPDAIRDLIRPHVLVGEKTGTTFNVAKSTGDASADVVVHTNSGPTFFFLEKQLRPGAKLTLEVPRTPSDAAFIPRREADSIPFSSEKLPQILDHFSIKPASSEAEALEKTLHECEKPADGVERKYCATSLESMVEFSRSILGTQQVRAVSTKVGMEGLPKQQYTVAPSGIQRMAGSELVVCHAKPYPYAVFYCHATPATRGYTVKMVGEDGTELESVVVCHADNSWWNAEHLAALQVLKVKPGGKISICHDLLRNQIVWAPSK